MRIRQFTILACLLALALVGAACNGGDGDDAAPEDEPVVEETPVGEVEATPEDEEAVAETPEDEEATPEDDEAEATPEEDEEATPEDDEAEATPEEDEEATPEDDEATPDTDADEVAGETVEVTLTEMAIELDVEDSDPVTLPAGTITFQISNDGEAEHSLNIEPADGEMEEQELGENLQPGDSTEWEVELVPGDYTFYCPVGDHREQGMEINVTVE
jgi:uncharacterized cupredoxin-like copper-binding protein